MTKKTLANVYYLALATWVEGIRHRTLWAIICLAAVLTMGNLVITTLFSWDLGKVSIEFTLSAVAFTGLLIVFFLGLRMLADDLERDRIFMILSRPVSVSQYLAGKLCGLAGILGVATTILGLAGGLSMLYVFWKHAAYVPPDFSWQIYVMALCTQFMSLVVVMAFTILFFCFASSSFVALLLAVCTYLVGQNMVLLRRIVTENAHAGILTGQENLVNIVSWIFPNLSLFNKKYEASYGFGIGMDEFLFLALYCASYSALMIMLATFVYRYRERV
jgi:ABC-type transport system involved in multi-copper enzyme maturation permease subunit